MQSFAVSLPALINFVTLSVVCQGTELGLTGRQSQMMMKDLALFLSSRLVHLLHQYRRQCLNRKCLGRECPNRKYLGRECPNHKYLGQECPNLILLGYHRHQ